jgi:hypothetical protein
MIKQRQFLGVLGLSLPFAVWISAVCFGGNPVMLDSISATYYMNSFVLFVGIMIAVGVFLIFYDGYDIKDSRLTTVTGIAGIVLALFPCGYREYPHNFLALNTDITSIFHFAGAFVFFGLMCYIMLFQFTQGGIDHNPDGTVSIAGKIKIARNMVFKICGITMVVALVFGFGLNKLFDLNTVYLGESIALVAFGIGWLVKGRMLIKEPV